jgi:hypothetical protein
MKLKVGEDLYFEFDFKTAGLYVYDRNHFYTTIVNYGKAAGCGMKLETHQVNHKPIFPFDLQGRVFEIKYYYYNNENHEHRPSCKDTSCPGWECWGSPDPLYMALTGSMQSGMHMTHVIRRS